MSCAIRRSLISTSLRLASEGWAVSTSRTQSLSSSVRTSAAVFPAGFGLCPDSFDEFQRLLAMLLLNDVAQQIAKQLNIGAHGARQIACRFACCVSYQDQPSNSQFMDLPDDNSTSNAT